MNSQQWISTSMPYLAPGHGDAWATEAAAGGGRGSQRIAHAGEVAAPADVAALLGLADGDTAVVRRRIVLLDDRAVEQADSYYPSSIAGGTALADPRKIPGGAITLLASLGYVASRVQEDVTARRPTEDEQSLFSIDASEPVLILTRLMCDAAGRPFQVDVLTVPAKLRRYRYQLEVT